MSAYAIRGFGYLSVLVAVAAGGVYVGSRFPPPAKFILPPVSPATLAVTPAALLAGFEPPELDLGEQGWNLRIPLQFHFVNRTQRTVLLDSVESSCECTIVDPAAVSGVEVRPGESWPVDAEFHTQTIAGEKRRAIVLRDIDGNRWTANIRVRVVGSWDVSADTIDFGDVIIDDGSPTIERVVRFSSTGVQLLSVDGCEGSWLGVDTPADAGAAAGRPIVMTIAKRGLTEGPHSASLVVRTSCPVKPAGVVFVKARGIHALAASPPRPMLLGKAPCVVSFFDSSGAIVRIISANSDTGGVSATVLDDGRVELANPAGAALPEPAVISVADEQNRRRTLLVPAL